jgi:hypothetical protein
LRKGMSASSSSMFDRTDAIEHASAPSPQRFRFRQDRTGHGPQDLLGTARCRRGSTPPASLTYIVY